MKKLGNFMFNAVVSPDLKYVVYTNVNGMGNGDIISEENLLNEMDSGFYIKNINTDNTVFYPLETKMVGGFHLPLNWVNKKGLEELIGFPIFSNTD